MPVYLDATETRSRTRLPERVVKSGIVVAGLEQYTGADLLLSPLDTPLTTVDERLTSQVRLRRHSQSGVLVQRKSGRDFVNSLDKLAGIQCKMEAWGLAWLLVTGRFECDGHDKCKVNGRSTGYSYWATVGALDAWQLRGGGVTVLSSDGQVEKWLALLLQKVQECYQGEKALAIRPVKQMFHDAEEPEILQAMQTLSTLPGVGIVTALSIARATGGLRASLELLSEPRVWTRADKPAGVGQKLIGSYRAVMGLGEGESMGLIRTEEETNGPSR